MPESKSNISLIEMDLHVTNRCSLRCRHCVFSSGDRILPEMSLSQIFGLVDDFASITTSRGTINLFGGEVLLRKDIFEIITKAKQKSLAVGVTTNCQVPGELVERLMSIGINRLTSDLDGANPKTHDWLRNKKGNFNRVLSVLKKSVANNIYTTVNAVLYEDNTEEVEPILELCQSIGVDGLAFYYLTPTGRGLTIKDKMIGPQKWLATKKRVLDWLDNNQPSFSVCWEEAYESVNDPLDVPRRCEKEHTETIFVRSDGEVYSCALLESAPCSLGNITQEKLGQVLSRREKFAFSRCRGCPALAFYVKQDLFATDPRAMSKTTKLGCPYNYRIIYDK